MIKYIELEETKKVKEILPIDNLKTYEGFVFAYYFVKEGDEIVKITHSAERPACILFESEDFNSLMERIGKSETQIKSNIVLV